DHFTKRPYEATRLYAPCILPGDFEWVGSAWRCGEEEAVTLFGCSNKPAGPTLEAKSKLSIRPPIIGCRGNRSHPEQADHVDWGAQRKGVLNLRRRILAARPSYEDRRTRLPARASRNARAGLFRRTRCEIVPGAATAG